MEKVNHVQRAGVVFCAKTKKVQQLDFELCKKCQFFNGTFNGNGIECLWMDETVDGTDYVVNDPIALQERFNKARNKK